MTGKKMQKRTNEKQQEGETKKAGTRENVIKPDRPIGNIVFLTAHAKESALKVDQVPRNTIKEKTKRNEIQANKRTRKQERNYRKVDQT
jgi:hypothetical protein